MAFGSDGSVSIDSRVNSKGFNSGISSMMGALGKLAAVMAVVFSISKITAFGKSAVDEASKMASALIGLQSVVEGTGNSLSGAQDFIKSFVADGLIPAGDAITAYKNLLLRGYNTSQIEKTMTALKDSAAFGRQGSLTMGEALRGASEGLKNENSLLVDNAGVTKNVSKMWLDYARSIGVAVTSLTKQDKILAEVAGIMEETRFQTGDAAKAAGTYAGQVSALTTAFTMMKVGLGNILMPILAQVIPYIRAIVDALTVYFNRIAVLVSLFFGVDMAASAAAMGATAENTEVAAGAQEDLADSTKEAGKAAKGALASFDELNVLAKESAETGSGGAGAGAGVDAGGGGLAGLDPPKVDTTLDALKIKVEKFRADLLVLLEPAIAAFKRLMVAMEPLNKTIGEGLEWFWENVLVPFGKWVITSLLPKFFDLLAAGARLLNIALIVLKPVFKWLWDNILLPLATGIGATILMSIEGWTMAFTALASWLEGHPDLFANFGRAGTDAWKSVQDTWALAGEWFKEKVVEPLGVLFDRVRLLIELSFGEAWTRVKAPWISAGAWFAINVTDKIRSSFASFLNWIPDGWRTAFQNIVNSSKTSVNSVIGLLNGMIRGLVSAINSVGDALRNFRINIPAIPLFGFPGLSFSAGNIPHVSAPSIPYLATGAVIPPNAQFAAMLGDQTSGRNLEAPEGLIRQIIQEEIGSIQASVDISFQGSLASVAQLLKPHIDRETFRLGKSMIQRGTT